MPLFQYKARDGRGEAVSGQIEAGSADAVANQLLNAGVTPISIEETELHQDVWAGIWKKLSARRPSLDDLILLCRQMYTLTKAGVPLVRGLAGLAETSKNPILAEVLQRMRSELESGRELSAAMSLHPQIFSPLMVSMVRVGEHTGQLDEAFLQLAQYLELDRDTRNRIKAALRYPLFVLLGIAVAIGVVNVYVIPEFAKVFKGMNAELPWQTKVLIATSDFFVSYVHYLVVGLIGTIIGLRYYVNTGEGRYRWDKLKLHLPIVGSIIRRSILARFARSFAMTTRAGVPLIQALSVVAKAVDNDYVSERVLSMRNGVERGDSLTRTAIATNLYTPLVLQMIAVGEETGSVERMMDEVADFYEREVDYELKTLSSSIEPLLLIAVGLLVLILALGIFLPLWELTSLAKR